MPIGFYYIRYLNKEKFFTVSICDRFLGNRRRFETTAKDCNFLRRMYLLRDFVPHSLWTIIKGSLLDMTCFLLPTSHYVKPMSLENRPG